MPELKGHTAFHARVAANALGIVARELEYGPAAAEAEKKRLVDLIGSDGTLDELNRVLCTMIRERQGRSGHARTGRSSRAHNARQGRDRPAKLFGAQAEPLDGRRLGLRGLSPSAMRASAARTTATASPQATAGDNHTGSVGTG